MVQQGKQVTPSESGTEPIVVHSASRTGQDISSEVEITSGDRYTAGSQDEYIRVRVKARPVNDSVAEFDLTIRVAIVDGAVVYEEWNDTVTVSAGVVAIDKTSDSSFKVPAGLDVAVYITSADAGDTSVAIECELLVGSS